MQSVDASCTASNNSRKLPGTSMLKQSSQIENKELKQINAGIKDAELDLVCCRSTIASRWRSYGSGLKSDRLKKNLRNVLLHKRVRSDKRDAFQHKATMLFKQRLSNVQARRNSSQNIFFCTAAETLLYNSKTPKHTLWFLHFIFKINLLS